MPRRRILRRCAVCGRVDEKTSFLRVVRKKDGGIVFDIYFKEFGRSVYICKREECIKKLFKRKKLERALRISFIDKEFKENLKKQMLTYIKEVKDEKTQSV